MSLFFSLVRRAFLVQVVRPQPYVPGRTSRLLSDARGRPTAYIVAPGTKSGQHGAMHWYYSKAIALWG